MCNYICALLNIFIAGRCSLAKRLKEVNKLSVSHCASCAKFDVSRYECPLAGSSFYAPAQSNASWIRASWMRSLCRSVFCLCVEPILQQFNNEAKMLKKMNDAGKHLFRKFSSRKNFGHVLQKYDFVSEL
jgi:hypothetical protein